MSDGAISMPLGLATWCGVWSSLGASTSALPWQQHRTAHVGPQRRRRAGQRGLDLQADIVAGIRKRLCEPHGNCRYAEAKPAAQA